MSCPPACSAKPGQVTGVDPDDSLFVGIARPHDSAAYPDGVEHSTVWVAQATGTGTQSVSWPDDGRWTVVAMNSDLSADVAVSAQVQVEAPHQGEITAAVFATGAIFGGAGGLPGVGVTAPEAAVDRLAEVGDGSPRGVGLAWPWRGLLRRGHHGNRAGEQPFRPHSDGTGPLVRHDEEPPGVDRIDGKPGHVRRVGTFR